jgi:hypothetical protein
MRSGNDDDSNSDDGEAGNDSQYLAIGTDLPTDRPSDNDRQ